MKRLLLLLLLPLLLGFSVPAIAHNEANGGCDEHCEEKREDSDDKCGVWGEDAKQMVKNKI